MQTYQQPTAAERCVCFCHTAIGAMTACADLAAERETRPDGRTGLCRTCRDTARRFYWGRTSVTLFDAIHAPVVATAGIDAGPASRGTATVAPAAAAAVVAGPAPHVVGVDLSLTATGVATRHSAELITSTGHRDDTLIDRRARLNHIRYRVISWCQAADLVVIEAPSFGSRGGSAHDRAGLWWLVVSALIHRDIAVIDISPKTRAKYATGRGNAGKDEVLTAAVRRLPIDVDNNNTADAAWLCAIGHDLLGAPLAPLPAAHRSAIDGLRDNANLPPAASPAGGARER